jgi:excisionase family DNA binding protein
LDEPPIRIKKLCGMINNKIIVIEKNDLEQLIQDVVKNALNQSALKKEYPNLFLDISEAAAYLKIAKQTLYGLTSSRMIPYFKKGKRLYFRRTELDHWLMDGKKATQSEILKNGLK